MNFVSTPQIRSIIVSAILGFLFGLGLIVSGMANPAKVIGFLNLSGAWDPSLILVMTGAIAVGLPGFFWAKKRSRSLLGNPINLPETQKIDKPLLIGAALFGIGWGLAGFCPGPALVSGAFVYPDALIFLIAMLAGMKFFSR